MMFLDTFASIRPLKSPSYKAFVCSFGNPHHECPTLFEKGIATNS